MPTIFAKIAYDYGINLMMTPNEQRECTGLPPLTFTKNNDAPKAVKCPICGGDIIQNDTKCKYCDSTLSWKEGD